MRVTGRAGLMFQEAALFPWLTVAGNVEMAMRFREIPKAEWPARVRDLLRLVHLDLAVLLSFGCAAAVGIFASAVSVVIVTSGANFVALFNAAIRARPCERASRNRKAEASIAKTNAPSGDPEVCARPDQHGFDVNIGGCDWGHPKSYVSPYACPTLEDGPDGEYLTDRLTDEAAAQVLGAVEDGDAVARLSGIRQALAVAPTLIKGRVMVLLDTSGSMSGEKMAQMQDARQRVSAGEDPTFRWVDDSSEDGYELRVYDAVEAATAPFGAAGATGGRGQRVLK